MERTGGVSNNAQHISAQFQDKRQSQGSFHASKMDLTLWFWEWVTCMDVSNSVNLNEQNQMSLCLALYCWADVLLQHQIHVFPSTFPAKSSNILNHADSSQLRGFVGFPHYISVLTYAYLEWSWKLIFHVRMFFFSFWLPERSPKGIFCTFIEEFGLTGRFYSLLAHLVPQNIVYCILLRVQWLYFFVVSSISLVSFH